MTGPNLTRHGLDPNPNQVQATWVSQEGSESESLSPTYATWRICHRPTERKQHLLYYYTREINK